MVAAAVDVWKDAQIFILPLIRGKNLPHKIVNNANDLINTARAQYKVTVLKPFEPELNMYYDGVHLNDKVGLLELIRHVNPDPEYIPIQSKTVKKKAHKVDQTQE